MTQNYQSHLSKDAAKNVETWLNEPKYAEYKPELEQMIADERWQDLEDAFFAVIEFGTAGIRGMTGIGSNRINKVTVGQAAQALCEYSARIDSTAAERGIAIACDTRLTSPELSKYVAEVCAGNGFKTYLFESYRSTPELSFAVRHLGCIAGVVISASHNPPADNGFKAYWSDGGQLVSPHDKSVTQQAAKVEEVHSMPLDEAVNEGLVQMIGKEVDEVYIDRVASEALSTERDVSIVYSPLHGAGQRNTLPVLEKAGFRDISVVKDQMVPDGHFPTIEDAKPNPEVPSANDRAVAQMLAKKADIAITNDPDADRIGIMVRQGDEPIYLTGNQSVTLATDFMLAKLKHAGKLTENHFVAKTIVTTDMMKAVADSYRVKTYGDMLIGFKYIGELMTAKESTDETFVIGGEESFGMLIGSYARDKDGAAGALPLAEYAAELKQDGKTLYDRLLELYAEHGLYLERLDTVVCPGASGFEQMQTIMKRLRTQPPEVIAHHEVTAVSDYQTGVRKTSDGTESELACPIRGNVVILEFGDERCRVTVRPSGTEPKIKFYVQWFEPAKSQNPAAIHDQSMHVGDMLQALSRELEGQLLAE